MRTAGTSALLLLALLTSTSALVRAAEEDAAAAAPPEAGPPASFVTGHSGVFGGRTVRYRAVAGETHLTDDEGEPVAALFSIAYLEADGGPERPATFVFNGARAPRRSGCTWACSAPSAYAWPPTRMSTTAPPPGWWSRIRRRSST